MSNSIGHNLLHSNSLLGPTALLEHQSKRNSPLHSSYASPSGPNHSVIPSIRSQATSISRKLPIYTSFTDHCLNSRKQKLNMVRQRFSFVARAVLTANHASEHAGKFSLDGNIELRVDVSSPTSGGSTKVEFRATNTNSDNLVLHWGVLRDKGGWMLPSRRPEGTKEYKKRALRTPFQRSGTDSSVKIEIDDPTFQAIEFLILDEGQNKWFKNNGDNFHVKLPKIIETKRNLSIPEDLVQIQAYLRWERNGKQMYSPQQEKEEYEAGRRELIEEVERGTSIEELRARLTKGSHQTEVKEKPIQSSGSKIPDELVQIQAYLRWEKAGKPNYSPDEEQREFEVARQELQVELDKGTTLDEIRKMITKGDVKTKVSKQLDKRSYSGVARIQRKKRDLMQILNKTIAKSVPGDAKPAAKSKALTPVELYAMKKEDQEGLPILMKKIYNVGGKQLLALLTKPAGMVKVSLVTDLQEPVILHWALSEKDKEWMAPPPKLLPSGSVLLEKAAETPFATITSDDPSMQVKVLELDIEEGNFARMPFVLLSDGNWIKDNGSDFCIDFKVKPKQKVVGDGLGTAKNLLEQIASMESEAQKSFMHRFNIAADLLDEARDAGELGLAGILVWMRFMATRQLIWNKNYNVKPREISKAQDRLTDSLQNIFQSYPQYRELLRMIMATVGRGGEGDVGQRIRDEILVVQRNNDCKGGMMEEWHQKLHNNTSPDDVVICQALMDYIKNDFDINVYWQTLNDNGITKERLLSYDRAIHNEPNFRRDQKESLLRDLGHYMRTLKAVHSGADLEAAISNCMGYSTAGQGFMVGVQINPISGLPSGFPELLRFVLEHVEDRNVEPLLEGLLEARDELRPLLYKSHDRLKDLIFLDIALDSTVRTAIERGYEELNSAGPEKLMYFIALVLENLALSSDGNEDLVYCLKGWNVAVNMFNNKDEHWALYAKSVLDRTRLSLASKAEYYDRVSIFTEEIIRAGSAASLSSLLNRLDPVLRKTANLGSWQIMSPAEVMGYVVVVDELLSVQNKSYEQPTILVAKHVRGEEEIPDGAVAVLTPDMPDVLSHVSVRARNCKVCFATCFDSQIFSDLQSAEGKFISLKSKSADIVYSVVDEGEAKRQKSSSNKDDSPIPSLNLVKKKFGGRYAISSQEFTNEMVGAKSRNIANLNGKVPSWIGIPTSVALPFGVFEEVLSDSINKEVFEKLKMLKNDLESGDVGALGVIRKTVLQLAAPPKLTLPSPVKNTNMVFPMLYEFISDLVTIASSVEELKNKMKGYGMPWPGDEGSHRWEQAWTAIKKVWASKWNERAYFSTKKVGLDHDFLCMAVLVQEIISADYAFVIHTTNPSSEDSTEIYAEVVKGLGETLVGAYPGRSMSFICKKNDLDTPKVLGYPSKPIGLFIRQSIIFRSDSNGEDLEGYAGAGLYDSVPMDEEEEVVLDYTSDPLIIDGNFRKSILTSIARAGSVIEELYGSAQDIEGVIKDNKLYVVQTRPQMLSCINKTHDPPQIILAKKNSIQLKRFTGQHI
ncbi:hypothetical protein V2J09_019943 [Rumex salicifolius]